MQNTASLGWPIQWEARQQSALWRYNLHYFDYLLQPGLEYATGVELMDSWRLANPLGSGAGWDPYPISLRLVNWIKFAHQHGELPAELMVSLAQQTAYLAQRVEHHLSGNHLLTNGKGLWFGGAALGEAAWEKAGRDIVLQELREQILPDGGHYELSPMYHSIVLEDLLDLVNLEQARGREVPTVMAQAAGRARAWLAELVDPRGRIPLLNDAAHGIATQPEQLAQYADSLGVVPDGGGIKRGQINGWQWRDLSGYYLLSSPPWRVLFNAAPMAPDHQPGHAHCDMLSILLQYGGQDILCDTGVFEYQEGRRREFCRSTAAHNTVVLDGLEQSEVWKAFRLGRRGQIQGPWISRDCLAAGHNGFAQQCKGLGHTRRVVPLEDGVVIADHLRGPGRHSFKAYYHFAPGVELAPAPPGVAGEPPAPALAQGGRGSPGAKRVLPPLRREPGTALPGAGRRLPRKD